MPSASGGIGGDPWEGRVPTRRSGRVRWTVIAFAGHFMLPNGGRLITADRKHAHPSLKSALAMKVLQLLRTLTQEGLTPNPLSLTFQDNVVLFQQGRMAMNGENFTRAVQLEDPTKSKAAGKMGYAPMPSQKLGPDPPVYYGSAWTYAIDKNSKVKDAAWEYIRFITSPEIQKLNAAKTGNGATSPGVYDDPDVVRAKGRSQRKAIRGRVVVDASGDGLVAHKSGAELENKAQDPRSRQPMTLMVRVMDVDVPRFRALPREEKQRLVNLGIERGELFFKSLPLVSSPAGHDGFLLMTRVTGRDGGDEEDLTAAEAEGRRQALSVIGYLRREVPGFERCRLVALAPWIGIRETWRVAGDYVLTEDDVLSGRQFPDAIAQGGGPVDVHHARGADLTLVVPPAPFSTPYRCLRPSGVEGLLVVGRCVSATREAMGALRHMGSAMALGHAAGVAAALAVQATVPPRRVDADELRAVLRAQAAIVDSPLGGAAAGTAGGTR